MATSASNNPHILIEEEIVELLMGKARNTALNEYNTSAILPCGSRESLSDCFTVEEDLILFWYDIDLDYGRTTKLVMHEKKELNN